MASMMQNYLRKMMLVSVFLYNELWGSGYRVGVRRVKSSILDELCSLHSWPPAHVVCKSVAGSVVKLIDNH